MKAKKSLFVALVMIICLCSCARIAVKKNNENLMQVDVGMSKDQVLASMGTPQLSELYHNIEGREVQVLYYLTERDYPAAVSIRERCTPLVFVEDKLQGWGESAYMKSINVLK